MRKAIELSKEHLSIMDHTIYRAAGQRYCGSSKEMRELVDAGLMRSVGKAGWCPDEFFTITNEGREALSKAQGEGKV